jgi:uncharacterized protein (TIGR03083 family)
MITGDDILAAGDTCHDFLSKAADADWSAPVPGLDFTVTSVVAHGANGPVWYAVDLWSDPSEDAAFDLKMQRAPSNAALLASLRSAARVCAASVDAAPPETRGFHPDGSPDPSGFAAMACDELLVHTDDAACGLGLEFSPDRMLAGRVLARLFPWHEPGGDPWRTLLWANGRIDLPGQPRQERWTWHCAPLSEWDGKRRPPR